MHAIPPFVLKKLHVKGSLRAEGNGFADDEPRAASNISAESSLPFPADATITLHVAGQALGPGPHELAIHVIVQDVGSLDLPISDTLA